jgi:hypothetical protein
VLFFPLAYLFSFTHLLGKERSSADRRPVPMPPMPQPAHRARL